MHYVYNKIIIDLIQTQVQTINAAAIVHVITTCAWWEYLDSIVSGIPVSQCELAPMDKWSICSISARHSEFYPRNINHIPEVKFFAGLGANSPDLCFWLNTVQSELPVIQLVTVAFDRL